MGIMLLPIVPLDPSLGLGLPKAELRREIAYVIRRYKPGKARSRFEIEISSLDGSRRRVLPTPDPPNEIRWLDHSTLIWSGERGLWKSKLSPWRPRLAIAVTPKARAWDVRFTPQADEICNRVREVEVEERPFSWAKGRITPIPKLTEYDRGRTPDYEFVIKDRRGKPRMLFIPEGADSAVAGAMNGMSSFCGSLALPRNQGIWILARGGMSTAEYMQGLVWEKPDGKQVARVEDAYSLDADPRRDAIVYASWMHIAPLGKLSLFMNQLEVCNWKTGAKKVLVAGHVSISAVTVRPLN